MINSGCLMLFHCFPWLVVGFSAAQEVAKLLQDLELHVTQMEERSNELQQSLEDEKGSRDASLQEPTRLL